MFGIKKRQQESLYREDLLASVKRIEETVKETASMDSAERIEARQKKQENMLEEALDLLDEYREGISMLREAEEKREEQAGKQQEKLLELIMAYGEYMENLHHYISGSSIAGPEWEKQWEMMDISLKRLQETCGLFMISDEGKPADPERIQVVKQETGPDGSIHNYVVRTVIPGWIYNGKVIQKAKAAVYKYQEEQ